MSAAVRALRAFARDPVRVPRCDFCNAVAGPDHEHVIDPRTRDLRCTCAACALLFDAQGGTNLKRIPRRTEPLNDFRMTDAQWEAMRIPITMAFFMKSSAIGSVAAFFPSPAGATESALPPGAWDALVTENEVLKTLASDVEALLVHRAFGAREVYIVSVDRCFELVALLRMHWRGVSGGTEAWSQIGLFFAGLRGSAPVAHA